MPKIYRRKPPSKGEPHQLPLDVGKTPVNKIEDGTQANSFPRGQGSCRPDSNNLIGCQLLSFGQFALLLLALCVIAIFAKGSQSWLPITWALVVMLGQMIGIKFPPHNPTS